MTLTDNQTMIARETYWLLNFFSENLEEQWACVPDRIDDSIVAYGQTYARTNRPTLLLALVLCEHLEGWVDRFTSDDATEVNNLEILDEIRVLLYWFLLEGRDEVFTKPEEPEDDIVGELYLIWRTIQRLCSFALEQPSIQKMVAGSNFSFHYFLETYASEKDD